MNLLKTPLANQGDGVNPGNARGSKGIVHLYPVDETPFLPGIGARGEEGGEDDGNISLPRSKSTENSTTDTGEDSPMDLIAEGETEALVRGLRDTPTFLKTNSADRALLSKTSSPPAPLSRHPSERSPAGGTEGSVREPPGGKRAFRYLDTQIREAAEKEAAGEGSKRRFGERFGLASVALAAKISSGIRGEPGWTTAGGDVLSRKLARR